VPCKKVKKCPLAVLFEKEDKALQGIVLPNASGLSVDEKVDRELSTKFGEDRWGLSVLVGGGRTERHCLFGFTWLNRTCLSKHLLFLQRVYSPLLET